MSQATDYEQSSDESLTVSLGDESFPCRRRAVMLGSNQALFKSEFGIQEVPGLLSEGFVSDVSKFNQILNTKLNETNIGNNVQPEPAINAFWFNHGGENRDIVILKVPVSFDSKVSNLMSVIKTDTGCGSKMIHALTQESADEQGIQNFLATTIKGSIDPSRIVAKTVVVCNVNVLDIVRQTPNWANDSKLLYQNAKPYISEKHIIYPTSNWANDNKSLPQSVKPYISPQTTPQSGSPVDLSKFVKKSMFFRNKPNQPTMQTTANSTTIPVEKQEMDKPEQNLKRIIKEVETDDEKRLHEIANTVTNRAILGKFEHPIVIRGLNCPDMPSLGYDYQVFTEEGTMLAKEEYLEQNFDSSGRLSSFHNYIYNQAGYFLCVADEVEAKNEFYKIPDGVNLLKRLILSHIKDEKDSGTTALLIDIPVYDWDIRSRPTNFTAIFCKIPTAKFGELTELITKNPLNAERFIEIAFEGIDNVTKRRPVQGVVINDVRKFLPEGYQYTSKSINSPDHFRVYSTPKSQYNAKAITEYLYPQLLPEFIQPR